VRTAIRMVMLALSVTALAAAPAAKTDAEIRQELMKKSISAYSGSCPCPFSKDRAGRNCGNRSAYSKPGGKAPLCYDKDVTQKMIDEYRKKNN
jgi:hypothetical protein